MVEAERGSIFVNCPFDDAYQPIFDAVVFAILACGYKVASALEIADSGELRLEKLYRLIATSAHSIHDISRVEMDGGSGLPRFNMPIELGIALGHGRYAKRRPRPRLLILDRERYRYQVFASDLAGLDIAEHGSQPERAIACVRHFLSADVRDLPTEDRIAGLYRSFEALLPDMAAESRQSVAQLNFLDRVRLVDRYLLGAHLS